MRNFQLNGTEFNEESTLTVTAPELGTITATPLVQTFITQGSVLGLDLGWLQTAHPCQAPGQTGNARLSLYSNGKAYHSLQLAYLCPCPHQAHNRSLRWMVSIDGDAVRADSLGTESRERHNHALAAGYEHLQPERVEPATVPVRIVKPQVAPKPLPWPVATPAEKTTKPVQLSLF
ncbi:hypothetical protein [Spirosoma sp.]|uniref:hypothetical protein n=1 Tax=Spirosoma sp. TaxID=1899569 RepID=UPI00260253E0|nr:hypothetical protein [Spirosoma sp.]MCX6217659.1 hypothetical protein [Spirosoma sp.]